MSQEALWATILEERASYGVAPVDGDQVRSNGFDPRRNSLLKTVSPNQHEILRNILTLHVPAGVFDLDVTYSEGEFYHCGVPEPRYKVDRAPQAPGVIAADARALPFKSCTMRSVVFDPPFLHAVGTESLLGKRFSGVRDQHELRALCLGTLVEAYRVLKPRGILVFKCQDIIESSRQVVNHSHFWQMALGLGFEDLDLFILWDERRMIGWNHRNQQHARKTHSYFLVFKKGPRR